MTTFNPEVGKEETKTEEVVESRQRSYSQDVIIKGDDQLETKTMKSHLFH